MKNNPLDFQRATACHVLNAFRNGQRRVLVADEAGLGKTTVASEVVRQVKNLDGVLDDNIYCIVYVCCNLQIAQQNIDTLSDEGEAVDLAQSRLSMQHYVYHRKKTDLLKDNRDTLVLSLTPATSFQMTFGTGSADERALIYACLSLLHEFENEDRLAALSKMLQRDAYKGWKGVRDRYVGYVQDPDMEDYFNSKVKLFQMCKYGFINVDDINTIRVPKLAPNCIFRTYGIDNESNMLAKDITITNSYVDFRVKVNGKNERIKTDIPVAEKLGCSTENIKAALETVKVPGRSELVDNKLGLTIMIDYAHSPESLENILKAVKSYTRGRVISVFGCGGDRDKTKRPLMGAISGKIAAYTIITSDNPRTEDPETIVKEIEEGIKKTSNRYECIVDRTEAIRKAIKMANKNDIVVLAGKGHETYQEINHEKHHYDEREIISQIIDEM